MRWVVDALSDEHTTVITTEIGDALAQLDSAMDVVLIDSVYDKDAVDTLIQKDAEPEYEYQLGVVTDTRESEDLDADAVIHRSLSADGIQERVDWLGARARYCKTLSEYYNVTRRLVERHRSDCTSEDYDRLRARRNRLETRLDELSESLDSKALYDAVLG